VTTPRVVTVWPTSGLVLPLPWIDGIGVKLPPVPATVTLTVQLAVCSAALANRTTTW
jgi:hypothetical protein